MYDSSLVEQFIRDIRVIDLGETVVIDCCPSAPLNGHETYEFMCLRCEEVTLCYHEQNKSCIDENGCIDLLEFSVTKQENNKTKVYIYGRVISLSVICKEIKIVK